MFRRFVALLSVVGVLALFSSCKADSGEEISELTTEGVTEEISESVTYETETFYEEPSETEVQETFTEPESTDEVADASSWSKEQIVAFYKTAAAATGSSVRSLQSVGLQDISVNNGQLGGVFSFVTPILSSFLSSSTTETEGITGEFALLTAEDVQSASAYTCGKGTVVEITLKEQTDTGTSDRSDGSVAHGISVVGDLLSIMGQLKEKGLPIDISVDKTVLTYKNPVIRAVVDESGKIVNGTWKCLVEISLSDYKFAGSKVDSTIVVIENTITVSGGFSA